MQILKKQRIKDSLYPIGGAVALVVLWHLAIKIFHVPEYILTGPYVVIRELINKASLLYDHALITLYEAAIGFFLAIIFAIPLSVAVVWWKPVEKTVMPIMVFLQTIPKIAIAPLFMIWFGFGYMPKVIISFIGAYFPIAIGMITGLRDVEPEVVDLLKSMSATPLQHFIKIRIPNSLPHFFNGLKLAILLSLTGAIGAEIMGAMKGLGYLVAYNSDRLNTKLLFAAIVVLLLIGKVTYSLVEWVERYAISWHVVMREQEKIMFTT